MESRKWEWQHDNDKPTRAIFANVNGQEATRDITASRTSGGEFADMYCIYQRLCGIDYLHTAHSNIPFL